MENINHQQHLQNLQNLELQYSQAQRELEEFHQRHIERILEKRNESSILGTVVKTAAVGAAVGLACYGIYKLFIEDDEEIIIIEE